MLGMLLVAVALLVSLAAWDWALSPGTGRLLGICGRDLLLPPVPIGRRTARLACAALSRLTRLEWAYVVNA